ncbi:hypothetical protein HaLaN_26337, partial [Haematococcus lacustris]
AVAATTREETEHVLQGFLQDPKIVGLAVHSRAAPATLNKNKSQLNTSYSMLEAGAMLPSHKLFFVTRPTTYEERCSHLYKSYMTDYKLLCMVLCTLATGKLRCVLFAKLVMLTCLHVLHTLTLTLMVASAAHILCVSGCLPLPVEPHGAVHPRWTAEPGHLCPDYRGFSARRRAGWLGVAPSCACVTSFPHASYPHASYPPGSYPPGSYQPPSYPTGSYLPAPASHASSYMPAPPPSPYPHGWVAPWHHIFAGPPNSLQPQPAPWPCIPTAPWIDPQAAQRLHEFQAHEAAGKALKMIAAAAAI